MAESIIKGKWIHLIDQRKTNLLSLGDGTTWFQHNQMKLIRRIISKILILYKGKLIPDVEGNFSDILLMENIQKTVYLIVNKTIN